MTAPRRYVPPDRWRAVLVGAMLGGSLAAGLDVPLRWAVQQIGWTPPAGSRISAGCVILVAMVAQLLYPNRGVAVLSLLAALATYLPSTFLIHGVVIRDFGLRALAVDLAFVGVVELVVGAILILSLQKVFASRVHIGYDPRTHCTGCGYSLRGLTERRCPECGRAFEPAVAGTDESHNNDG